MLEYNTDLLARLASDSPPALNRSDVEWLVSIQERNWRARRQSRTLAQTDDARDRWPMRRAERTSTEAARQESDSSEIQVWALVSFRLYSTVQSESAWFAKRFGLLCRVCRDSDWLCKCLCAVAADSARRDGHGGQAPWGVEIR